MCRDSSHATAEGWWRYTILVVKKNDDLEAFMMPAANNMEAI